MQVQGHFVASSSLPAPLLSSQILVRVTHTPWNAQTLATLHDNGDPRG